jgi:opacity protein-like surface antigen
MQVLEAIMTRKVLTVCGLAAMMCSLAWGQGARPDFVKFAHGIEVSGGYGGVHVSNLIYTHERDAAGFDAGVAWRAPLGKKRPLGAELRLARHSHDSTPSKASGDYDQWHAWLVAVDAVYHFRVESRTELYLLGGYGFMSTEGSSLCTACGWNPDPVTGQKVYIRDYRSGSGNANGPLFGGGLKVAITSRVFIRLETIRLYTTGHTRWGWSGGGIGIGVRL